MKEFSYPCFNGKDLDDEFIFTDIIRSLEYINLDTEDRQTHHYVFERNGLLWRVRWSNLQSIVSVEYVASGSESTTQDRIYATLQEFAKVFNEVNDSPVEEEWTLRCTVDIYKVNIVAFYHYVKED